MMSRSTALALVALAAAVWVTPTGQAATRVVGKALFAQNAGSVGGIKASRTPTPNRLLALRSNGRFPPSVLPAAIDATTLDGISVSATATPQDLLPLDGNGQFPLSAMPVKSINPDLVTRVYSDQQQLVNDPHETLVRFDRVAVDTAGAFDPSTPDQLTVRVPGVYLLTADVAWNPDGFSLDRVIRITTNEGNVAIDMHDQTDATIQTTSTIDALPAGDVVKLQINGSDPTDIAPSYGEPATLSMTWLAPG